MTGENGMGGEVDTRVKKKNFSKDETLDEKMESGRWKVQSWSSQVKGTAGAKPCRASHHNTVLHYHRPWAQSHVPLCGHVNSFDFHGI